MAEDLPASDGAGPRVAGVELGGTKALAVLARGGTIIERVRWPTGEPEATLAAIGEEIARWHASEPVAAIGLASFGPLCLDAAAPAFGRIVGTPKPLWSGVDVRGYFAGRFAVPIGFDTDVAGAALAEGRWGATRGCAVHVYLTIGTGVGGGIVVDGRPLHGRAHPEIGHVRVRRRAGDAFAGTCPFHGDCLEGLVSGPAIAARAGRPGRDIDDGDPVWDGVAADVAELMAMLILTLSPERIVVGGGVMQDRPRLFARIRAATAQRLAGYVGGIDAEVLSGIIVPPGLGVDAGPLGAVVLALDALA